MTTDNRIPVPSFYDTLEKFMGLVQAYPDQTSRHAYIDSAGHAHDLTGCALDDLGAPIHTAAAGHLRHHDDRAHARGELGTPRNVALIPLIWNRLFLGADYDAPSVLFLGMANDRALAQAYLVYALLGHITNPEGRGRHALLTWEGELIRGLKSFRRFLLSPTSGFLVQTHGAHQDLLQYVDELTARALATLPTGSTS